MTLDADRAELAVFGDERAIQELRDRASGHNVLALVTDSTADEWYRRWNRTPTGAEQIGIVECFGFSRGAAATETTVVNDELAVSTVERPLDQARFREVLDRYLSGWASGRNDTVVYLDSLGGLLEGAEVDEIHDLLGWLQTRADETESSIVASLGRNCPPSAAAAFTGQFGETVGEPSFDTDASAAVRKLRLRDPTTFGYFRNYWREAVAALGDSERSFVQAGQLETGSDISTRMLGATLSALAQLDALSVRADTNGPNRYDLRDYDPERAAALGLAVDDLPE